MTISHYAAEHLWQPTGELGHRDDKEMSRRTQSFARPSVRGRMGWGGMPKNRECGRLSRNWYYLVMCAFESPMLALETPHTSINNSNKHIGSPSWTCVELFIHLLVTVWGDSNIFIVL